MKRILVTGGCGFVGSNLVAYLDKYGDYEITVLDNEVLGKREYIDQENIRFIKGDIRDQNILDETVAGKDAVVHLAADTRVIDSIENPRFNFENNVLGTFNLLVAMRGKNVRRLVCASTGGAILGEVTPPVHEDMVPRPMSPYGASKLAVEGYCGAFESSYGLKTTSLRFSNVYGPRSYHKGSVVAAFYKRILAGKPLIVYGDGSQVRDYVFVYDICQGIKAAIDSEVTGIYQLGMGIPTSLSQLIDHIKEIVAVPVEVEFQEFRQGEIRETYCNISKAREHLGYLPSTTLPNGLRTTWEWFTSFD